MLHGSPAFYLSGKSLYVPFYYVTCLISVGGIKKHLSYFGYDLLLDLLPDDGNIFVPYHLGGLLWGAVA